MRHLIFVSFASSLLLGVFMMMIMPAAALLHTSPTRLGELAECSYQCWHGITAGQTPINQVETMMDELNYRRVRRRPLLGGGLAAAFANRDCNVVFYYIQYVESINFPACGRVTLGDLILTLGTPDVVIYRNASDYELRWQRYRSLFVHVENWSSPHIQPLRITLSTPIDFSTEPRQGRWRGFMSVGRYCAIEQPEGFPVCS